MSLAPDLEETTAASRGGIPPNRRDGRTPATAPKRWGWLALPLAAVVALAVHFFASRGALPLPTRVWYIFLGGALTLSVLLAALQVPLPRVRTWLAETGPIFAAALLLLAFWQV